jgi:hypothetical protein
MKTLVSTSRAENCLRNFVNNGFNLHFKKADGKFVLFKAKIEENEVEVGGCLKKTKQGTYVQSWSINEKYKTK